MALIRPLEFRDGELPGVPRKQLDRLNAFFRDVRDALEPRTLTLDILYVGGSELDIVCPLKAEHVQLTRALAADSTVFSAACSVVDWSWNSGRLTIRYVGGLTVSTSYSLRLLVTGA